MNEEFVTFEIAQKLEEKGFDWDTAAMFERNILACRYDDYRKPTISQVLKWLREEKKIHIQILFACPPSKWEYIIVKMTNNELRETYTSFKSYEEAALEGIKFVLNNLI